MVNDSPMNEGFEYYYGPSVICSGPGSVAQLSTVLERDGIERALVVCGTTVGSTPAIMDPIRQGLGDKLVTVFDKTTPEKRASTAFEGVDEMNEHEIDGLVAVGGGSSVDIARAMSVFEAEDIPAADLFSKTGPNGTIQFPRLTAPKVPIYAIPTTFSGAELTCAAGVNLDAVRQGSMPDEPRQGPIYDPDIIPRGLWYDPEIIGTTPNRILAASAMNGLDHGIEMLYSRHANPITDATASHGLRLLQDSVANAVSDTTNIEAIGRTAAGVVLSSYGLIDPEADANKYSLIHAFGHIISRHYEIQQGHVHGIVAPSVLRYIFESVDGRRALLADSLTDGPQPSDADEQATAVIDAVTAIRDDLGLPSMLREVPGFAIEDAPDVARGILADVGLHNGPAELEPNQEELVGVIRDAY